MSVERGRMVELNFDKYRSAAHRDAEKSKRLLVPTYDFWWRRRADDLRVAPSVMNAIFAATGKPVRSCR